LRPGEAGLQAALGQACARAGRLDEAADALSRALALSPRDEEARFQLALVEIDRARPAAAIAALREVLRGSPGHAAARYNLGLTLLAAGDLEGARAELRALEGIDANLALQLRLRVEPARP
jgi:tetratricopeptide (TPR) repeat protein